MYFYLSGLSPGYFSAWLALQTWFIYKSAQNWLQVMRVLLEGKLIFDKVSKRTRTDGDVDEFGFATCCPPANQLAFPY